MELASLRYYVNQFSGKTDNFEFVCLNLSKKLILGWRYQKSKSQIVIRTLEILCAPIFRQKGQLWIFAPKFDQKRIFGWNFKNLSPDLESATFIYFQQQFWNNVNKFEFFSQNFPENWFWAQNIKHLSLDWEPACLRYMCSNFKTKRINFTLWT